jgi:hypothetical protein
MSRDLSIPLGGRPLPEVQLIASVSSSLPFPLEHRLLAAGYRALPQ